MPVYEYECAKCNQVSEALQKVSDPPLKKCPHCGGKVKKIMSLNSFQLKGGGWYVTDYKGKNSSVAAPGGDAGAGAGDSAPADTAPKTETKKKDKPKAEKASKSS
ncbi:MAG: zinc ribbon domain-containing protein [Desulfarculaceae bacterium]|nr:zinc ribbon domain-containing protein [Desulfarculaceae bacterium]